MLDSLKRVPSEVKDGGPVLVLLHGRGSHKGDLQGMGRVLPPGASLVTPQAPHAGKPWEYGPGWAWYRYLGEDRAEPDSLRASLEDLHHFLEGLPALLGFEPGSLVLGGFSQGGTMSLAFAMSHPGKVAGVINLSGFLVSPESLDAGPETLPDTPIFWAHGTQDPAVPFPLALMGRERIRGVGGDLEERDYPMGHWVSEEELADLAAWLRHKVPGWEGKEG